ncbi:MAG: DUF3068 domain-containing protein [Nocardioides sp.]
MRSRRACPSRCSARPSSTPRSPTARSWSSSTPRAPTSTRTTRPCLEEGDPRLVTDDIDVFATDRHTGEAVNDAKYLPADAQEHQGLINKFPFNTEKDATYDFWDGLLAKTVPAEYVGTTEIDGLETYEFHILVDEEPANVVGDVPGLYSMDKTMWIDPITGAIIDQEQHEVRQLDDGTTALDMSISFTDDTVAENVKTAKSNIKTLGLLKGWVPIVALIAGLVSLLVGIILVRPGKGLAEA